MAQTAQYDHIGSKYDEYAQTATLKRASALVLPPGGGAGGGNASWIWPVASASTRSC